MRRVFLPATRLSLVAGLGQHGPERKGKQASAPCGRAHGVGAPAPYGKKICCLGSFVVSESPVNIVEKSFWENDYYWAGASLPCRPDMGFAFDRSLARALVAHAPAEPAESVLEVGCAPAKWLVFYAERFGTHVSGIEYSEKGARLSRMNLAVTGVAGEISQADFFEIEPQRHDLVLSIGFIEHFTDPADALARHLQFVSPGGRLVVGVPNFRGLNGLLQRLADPSYLEIHNRMAMSVAFYRRFAQAHGLQLVHLGYLGGFDPVIVRLNRGPLLSPRRAIPGLVTLLESRFRRLRIADRLEHPWLSNYLLAVYRAPGG
jgi:SAM-dependent methyltransferase